MTIKKNYFVIPLITVLVAVMGSLFGQVGMGWYDNIIIKPDLTPPDYLFPIAWTTIYILTAISALIVFNSKQFEEKHFIFFTRKIVDFIVIMGLFIANAVLNALWTLIFFALQQIGLALFEMIILELTTLLLIIFIWKRSKVASLLLLPYLLWVGFATYLTYSIYILN